MPSPTQETDANSQEQEPDGVRLSVRSIIRFNKALGFTFPAKWAREIFEPADRYCTLRRISHDTIQFIPIPRNLQRPKSRDDPVPGDQSRHPE